MLNVVDYRKSNGSIDIKALQEAEVAAGDRCYRCGGFISVNGSGEPTLCRSCETMYRDHGRVDHETMVRCPKCRGQFSMDRWHAAGVYEPGEHDLRCPECSRDFTVSTVLIYSFTSPPVEPA